MTKSSLVLFLLPGFCLAQLSAVLSGTVRDPSGAVLSAAAITARSADTGAARVTHSDAQGVYRFFSLPVGPYEIHALKTGFTEEVRTGVRLVIGESATVNMDLAMGESSQQVTVRGDAPLTSVTTADISGLVGEQQIKDLPLNGRHRTLIACSPDVEATGIPITRFRGIEKNVIALFCQQRLESAGVVG